MKRLWCWVAGHRWRIVLFDRDRSNNLGHLHTFAGCLCRCRRCGAEWDDLGDEARAHFKRQGLL